MTHAAKRQVMTLWAALVLLLVVTMGATMGATTGVARAEPICAPREATVAQLATQFEERAIGRGLAQAGQAMVELYVSARGSWTIVVTDTAGISCLVASGEHWSTIPVLLGQVS